MQEAVVLNYGFVLDINNGFIIQYGYTSKNGTYIDLIFPMSFTNTKFSVSVLDSNSTQTTQMNSNVSFCIAGSLITKSKVRILCNTNIGYFYWLSIGY